MFTPVLAKHSKSFSLIDCISVGVDRMQRNSEPMRKQVETWPRSELTDVTAKVVITEWPTLSLLVRNAHAASCFTIWARVLPRTCSPFKILRSH